jgi:hypothetical protein
MFVYIDIKFVEFSRTPDLGGCYAALQAQAALVSQARYELQASV